MASASPAPASKKSKSSKSARKRDAAAVASPKMSPLSPLLSSSSASAAAASALLPSAAAAAQASRPRFLHPLHRCRFLPLSPHSIISLSYSPSGRLLAVGRSNGNIELWSVSYNLPQPPSSHSATASASFGANGWTLLKTIPGSGEPTVQVLLWCQSRSSGERLFSAGLNGRLIEWDLSTLAPRFATDTYGGAVWSGHIHTGKNSEGEEGCTIALGCEDGTIRLFDVSDPLAAPLYLKGLTRHSARVLSLSYSPDGQFIVSGGADGMIKLWDLQNDGRNIQRITVENKGRARLAAKQAGGKKQSASADTQETLIWSLRFLTPTQVLSGDSFGNLQIWELEFGTLLHSFPRALQGDVLSVVTNETRDVVYASGVEGKIVELKKVSMDKEGIGAGARGEEQEGSANEEASTESKWVLTSYHRHHSHDVYALAISPKKLPTAKGTPVDAPNNYLLVSGGVDTQLLLSPTLTFPDFNSIARLMPFTQQHLNTIAVADKVYRESEDGSRTKLPPRFLLAHDQHLQLYSLGSFESDNTQQQLKNKELNLKEQEQINVDKTYTHLLDINVNTRKMVDTSNPAASVWVAGGGLNLLCAALSPDSSFVACSDPIQVKLYRIQHKEGSNNPNRLTVKKIQVSHLLQPASAMTFAPDSRKLFVSTLTGPIQVLDLGKLIGGDADMDDDEEEGSSSSSSLVQTLEEHVPQAVYEGDLSSEDEEGETEAANSRARRAADKMGVIRRLQVSVDQQYLALSDELSHVWIYNLDSLKLHASLPSFANPVLDLAFHPRSSLLTVLCARNHLYLYDVEKKRMTDYSKQNLMALQGGVTNAVQTQAQAPPSTTATATAANPTGQVLTVVPASHLLAREQLSGLSFDASTPHANTLLLHGVQYMLHINLDQPRPAMGVAMVISGAQAQQQQSTQMSRRERKRKAMEGAEGTEAAAPAEAAQPPADPLSINFRLLTRYRPLLYAGYVNEREVEEVAATAQPASSEGKKKRMKGAQEDAASSSEEPTVDFSVEDRPVVLGSSLLVMEAPWVNILQKLPQPLARHRYGT